MQNGVLLDAVQQGIAAQPQQPRSAAAVATGMIQRLADQLHLEIIQPDAPGGQCEAAVDGARGGMADFSREITGVDTAPAEQHHQAFAEIASLADVARPVILFQHEARGIGKLWRVQRMLLRQRGAEPVDQ